jgi:hypothetical protein
MCPPEKLTGGDVTIGRRDTKGGREPNCPTIGTVGASFNGPLDGGRKLERSVTDRSRLVEDHKELITSEPTFRRVTSVADLLNSTTHLGEHFVADRLTIKLIDRAETINIDVDDRYVPAALTLIKRLIQSMENLST